MSGASTNLTLHSDEFALYEWACDGAGEPRSEQKSEFEIVFVTRGVFIAETSDGETPLTTNEVWLHPPGRPYRIHHPRGGDECTVITVSPELLHEYGGWPPTRPTSPSSSRMFRLQYELARAASSGRLERLHAEESVRTILELLFERHVSKRPFARPDHMRLVRRAQELLAERFAETLRLSDIASAVGSSRSHLCRVFQRGTGESLHQYQLALRLREGLARLDRGERDLTGLALDLGFSDHSHFTNAFGRAFGRPPSQFRRSASRHGQ